MLQEHHQCGGDDEEHGVLLDVVQVPGDELGPLDEVEGHVLGEADAPGDDVVDHEGFEGLPALDPEDSKGFNDWGGTSRRSSLRTFPLREKAILGIPRCVMGF